MPKHLRDLQGEGYPLDAYHKSREWFGRRGITIGYSRRRREWFLQAFGAGPGCCIKTLWCGLGAFIDHLDAPSGTIREFKAERCEVE